MKRRCEKCGKRFGILKTNWLKSCPFCGAKQSGTYTRGVVAAIAALLLSACASAPPQPPVVTPPPATVAYCAAPTIRDVNGHPITGATIQIAGETGVSNQDGYKYFVNVPAGQQTLVVTAPGYREYRGSYAINSWSCDMPITLDALSPVFRARRGINRLNNHALVDDDGEYLGLGATLFSAGWMFEHERERLEANLKFLDEHHVDFVRVIGVMDWPGREFGRQVSATWASSLRAFTDLAYDKYALRVEWCLFADAAILSPAARVDAVQQFIALAKAAPHKIHAFEIANEGWATRWTGAESEARRLARLLYDGTPNLVMVTSPQEASAESVALWYDGSLPGRAVVPFHLPRETTGAEGTWRAVRQVRDPVLATGLPWANDEPIGPGSSVASETDPLRLTMGAALTWLAKGAWYTFHAGAGISLGAPFDLARGRQANLWEVPNIDEALAGIHAVRQQLPPDLPNWEFGNNNRTFSKYPFDVEPIMPMVGDGRLLRAFAAVSGDRFIVMPLVGKVPVPFTPVRALHVDVVDPMTGQVVASHDGPFTWQGAAAIFKGVFR